MLLNEDISPTAEVTAGAAASARQRSNMYGFLSLVYQREPDAELLTRLDSADFRTALQNAGVQWGNEISSLPAETLQTELALEYTRLFIGPGKHVSPHESVYCTNGDGGILGKASSEAKLFIEATGFRFRAENTLIPDHIAVELEFMQGLTRYESQLRTEGDIEKVIQCLSLQQTFLERHLTHWIPAFCKKVVSEATLSFYRELASLTEDFIQYEQEAIRQQLAQLSEPGKECHFVTERSTG